MNKSDKILFHYTSLEGLLEITSPSKQIIWATNILYSNDESELKYSIYLLRKEVRNFRESIFQNALQPDYRFLTYLMENIDYEGFIPSDQLGFFVSSFSEEKDLLGQWRGYCPRGLGFSLGFKFSKLKECAQRHGFAIRRCIYDEQKQKGLLRKIIKSILDQLNSDYGKAEELKRINYDKFITKFIKLAPIFKHPKFKEEKEWRIIASRNLQLNKDIESIKFRKGQSMIVPYIEISLPKEGDNLIINHIVVGPTPEPILSKASVEMLLKSRKVRFDEIQYSTIPYRNW